MDTDSPPPPSQDCEPLIGLLPIPALMIEHDAGVLTAVEMNRPLRVLGLAGEGDAAPLLMQIGERVNAFAVSGAASNDFIWQSYLASFLSKYSPSSFPLFSTKGPTIRRACAQVCEVVGQV